MNNILNAQEAFAAVITGRNVLARLNFGNEAEEFAPISNFPADIYAKPHVEYCIQIETIAINGIEFTKPYLLDELISGQDVFLVNSNGRIVKGQYISECEDLVLCVKNGSVQRDFDNAQKHAKAIQSLLGIENDLVLKVVDFEKFFQPESKSKKRQSKKQNDSAEIKQQTNQAANDDNSLDDIIGPLTAQSPTSNDVEKKTSTVPFEDIAAAAVTKAQEIDNQAQERQWTRFHNDKPCLDIGNKSQYEIEYADLTAVVIHAQTPDEANSVVVKTQHWTEEQRKPLLSAISKRLGELQEQSKVKPNEPPSLMVQIQNAPDLTALDALEIDVSTRHPDIQPRLMGYVKKRRFELEQLNQGSSIDGELT
ncbi:hypothetical protein GWP85_06985 [Acinetobacter beijerinckii]|uniref:hypothetical protein n=1 Tax=Acinetobacter beijerinckii TaxID=262668 RepID=UPI0023DD6D81|nr:hypothetical protein [Acinetobacter beijerinckii]MDF2417262.1 hypothetical protein [Acinetobacter beijerinckii]